MAVDRNVILSWLGDLATALMGDAIDLADTTRRITSGFELDPPDLAGETLSIMRAIAESASSPDDFGRLAAPEVDAGDTRDAAAVLVAIGLSIAGARIAWPSRPAARAARSRVADAGAAALAVASSLGPDGADLFGWISSVVATSVRVISDIAANGVPVVRVETGISLPSTFLAYQLYGDAARAQGLVDIARSGTPMLMPAGFDALAK
ncbi:hypothetical protein J2857_003622 [Neorhizobium galegae]|uniref:hypothetical protein n=1 Tax=Neorhizobium galegae TaxID=399 RepID=UPI001AE43357|nr:hypothetical protein [Neorhizobium galegae]MBP2560853.1 hypothetical protein [Neorhizobium galegae]